MKLFKNHQFKRSVGFVILSIMFLLSAGCSNTTQTKFLNYDAENVAIEGFDPVAYFIIDGAAKGNPQISVMWSGVKWHFSTVENKDKFIQDPDKFAPQFGGLCSLNLAHNQQKTGDPRFWEIRDGKLYLQNNEEAHNLWLENGQSVLGEADKNWSEIRNK